MQFFLNFLMYRGAALISMVFCYPEWGVFSPIDILLHIPVTDSKSFDFFIFIAHQFTC